MGYGHLTRPPQGRIDYKELRKTSPEALSQAVIGYRKATVAVCSATARLISISRCVVYDTVCNWLESDLRCRSCTTHL